MTMTIKADRERSAPPLPSSPQASATPVHRDPATIAPGHLYWAFLSVPPRIRIRTGPLPLGLQAAFEEEVPLPQGEQLGDAEPAPTGLLDNPLHIVCACVPGRPHSVVACGAARTRLQAAGGGSTKLLPSAIPEFILQDLAAQSGNQGEPASLTHAEAEGLAGSLNLFVGELEPPSQRLTRLRRRVLVLTTLLISIILLGAGLERRIRHDRALAIEATERAQTALADLERSLGTGVPVRISPDTLPAVVAIAKRSADAAAKIGVTRDAAVALAELLQSWPQPGTPAVGAPAVGAPAVPEQDWSCAIQSLGGTGDTLAATFTIRGDAAAFLRELSAPSGWSLQEPRLTNVGTTEPRKRAANPADRSTATEAAAGEPPVPLTRIALTMKRTPSPLPPHSSPVSPPLPPQPPPPSSSVASMPVPTTRSDSPAPTDVTRGPTP